LLFGESATVPRLLLLVRYRRRNKIELLKAARSLGAECDDCPLKQYGHPPVLPPKGQPKKPLFIICAEGPGKVEERQEDYLVGPTGTRVDNTLRSLGMNRKSLYLTNAVMCRHSRTLSLAEWNQAIKCCRPRLKRELKKIQSKWVLAMGGRSLTAFTGKHTIRNWMGGPIEDIWDGEPIRRTVIPTVHPAWLSKPDGAAYNRAFIVHTARARDFARGKLKPYDWGRRILEPGPEAVDALKQMFRDKKPLGFDVENIPGAGIIMAVGIGNEDVVVSMPWHEYYCKGAVKVDALESRPRGKQIKKLIEKLLKSRIPKIMHNGQHDVLVMEDEGIKVNAFEYDTMHAWTLVGRNTLKRLSMVACILTHCERWKDHFAEGTDEKGADIFAKRPELDLREYNSRDVAILPPAQKAIWKLLQKEPRGEGIYKEIMERDAIALRMHRTGIKVDTEPFARLHKSLRRRALRARRELKVVASELGMDDFNPNSVKDRHELFFNRLSCPVHDRSEKTGAPSLGKRTLQRIIVSDNPVLSLAARTLSRYNRWKKLDDVLRKMPLGEGNVVHSEWDPTGAKTHRWAGRNPNLMNVPNPNFRLSKDKKKKILVSPGLRQVFVAFNNGWVTENDYAALELRLIALFADDEKWLTAFRNHDDVHTNNTIDLLNISRSEVTETIRLVIKTFTFAAMYGASPRTVYAQTAAKLVPLGVTPPTFTEVELMHRRLYAKHPNVRGFQNKCIRSANQDGYIEAPLTKHRIYFNGVVKPTEPTNYLVQHTGVDIINKAIVPVAKELRWDDTPEPEESIMAQVHDSLVIQGQDPHRLFEIPNRHMPYKMVVDGRELDCIIETKIGRSWGSAVEVADLNDVDRVVSKTLKEERLSGRSSTSRVRKVKKAVPRA
jgi:uracil-DNA glycosylase family 4